MSRRHATKKKIQEQEVAVLEQEREVEVVAITSPIESVVDINTFEEAQETPLEQSIDEHREDLEAARSAARKSVEHLKTKSAKIRALAAQGYKVAEIAKILGIIYQHARNVLITPLKTSIKKAMQDIQEENINKEEV